VVGGFHAATQFSARMIILLNPTEQIDFIGFSQISFILNHSCAPYIFFQKKKSEMNRKEK